MSRVVSTTARPSRRSSAADSAPAIARIAGVAGVIRETEYGANAPGLQFWHSSRRLIGSPAGPRASSSLTPHNAAVEEGPASKLRGLICRRDRVVDAVFLVRNDACWPGLTLSTST
jgi:hypothetical protein